MSNSSGTTVVKKPVRVCVDARLVSGKAGGVESVVIGMANALSRLRDGDEEYLFLAFPGHEEWLRPYISGPSRVIFSKTDPEIPAWRAWLNKTVPAVRRFYHQFYVPSIQAGSAVPVSDGVIESAGVDVVHFTHQLGFLTRIPSIYHPHDLQHVHLPQFFTPREIQSREVRYRKLCEQATMIPVTSEWCKNDLIRQYSLPPDKIKVIVWPPVVLAYGNATTADLNRVRGAYALPDRFIFYPAQTFPHKNHLGLLRALALIRDRHNVRIRFVASGGKNEFYNVIQQHIDKLQLHDLVSFVGFVSPSDLKCLYELCAFVVVPTMFEAASGPVGEAFSYGKAVACSAVTSLPEQAGDAALLFDPSNVETIADALLKLWADDELRGAIELRAKERLSGLSWERTGRIFRAHYRRIAGRNLSKDDVDLIAAPAKY